MSDPPSPDPHLLAYVAGRDVECPVCKYNLRDLQSSCCPECGEALTLRLARAEPRLGLWLAMLVPLLLGAGLGMLFLLLCIRVGLPPSRSMPAVFSFIAFIPVSYVALRSRRRFDRAGDQTRIVLVAAANLAVSATFVWTLVTIR